MSGFLFPVRSYFYQSGLLEIRTADNGQWINSDTATDLEMWR